mmetsp:Transcript_33091/g.80059  ORF Transcript_33091/g.80059 Transcript_33091/m.80059 type:complete len:485 (-) Transcript_33091:111-1565(-)
MDGATTASTGSNSSVPPGGTSNNGGVSTGFLNLGNLGVSSPAVVGGMGLFSTGGGGGDGLASSFGASLGNGFTNDGNITGGMGGGSANPSFDLNDFPSLGGVGAVASGGASGLAPATDNGLAAALRQQQQLLQQQMMQAQQQQQQQAGAAGLNPADKSSNLYRLAMSSGIANGAASNFSMTTEDFPALGASGGDSGGVPGVGGVGQEGVSALGGTGLPPSSTPGTSGGILDSSGSNQLDYTGLIGSTGAPVASSGIQQGGTVSQTRTTTLSSSAAQSGSGGSSSTAGGSAGNAGSGGAIGGDYGLLGLLSVIRMTDADRNRLALGSDLTVLGLNLNSPDVLHSTFGGPFSDKPATKEPHYQLPMCYYMQPPALKTGHLSKFQLETLFYIFYALPKDVLQAYAAQELYSREWRYHVESKLWFKRATSSETGISNNNSSSSGGGANGQFIYFDLNTWERRMYGNVNQNIAGGFLPEDDVRVKFPSS